MRKVLSLMALLVLTSHAVAQVVAPITLPGKGRINVENLKGKIDTNMDISQLSLCELRVLRNAFAARQGYLFNNSELRQVFNTTSWYDSLAWDRYGNEEKRPPIAYTPNETAFINKIKAREEQLVKQNFKTDKGIVNMDNIINPFQLEVFPDELRSHLAKYGFGIVEADHEQLFQIYEKNDYCMFPNFVTTDLYLQLYHLFFDTMMRRVEEGKLSDVIASLCKQMHGKMIKRAGTADKTLKDAAEWNAAYFAVGYQLMTGKSLAVSSKYQNEVKTELNNCKASENAFSTFLEYTDIYFPYSLFRPRGHYTRSEKCEKYFRAMMWLQSVPFGTDKQKQLQRAALIAEEMMSDSNLRRAYDSVSEPITYLMGTPDNITIIQVGEIMKRQGVGVSQLLKNKNAMQRFKKEVEAVGDKQTRIRPKFEYSSHHKINFMPQRYQPDGEVMQEMVDCDNKPTKRDVPMGLDVMAALGSSAAERILINELKQDKQWELFVPNLQNMKQVMTTIDWNACVTNKWLDALNKLNTANDSRMPYFMKTPQWDKKNLNASLASWAELKHDAILYAKQPMVAECGDGSLPAPQVVGYVEPNLSFWEKAVALVTDTRNVLKRYQLMDENIANILDAVGEQAQFLLNVSKKELAGQKITEEEYDQIRYIGATFEYLSLEMIKEPDQTLMGWSDVQGTDKAIPVVADVLTSNGNNNPEPSILYEAVGPANEIYVVVEVNGLLRLMRGGVFSYREFKRPVDEQRMTDEEWQQKLKEYPSIGKPSWMEEIIVPIKVKPEDNETVFYGTGC